jgi:solute carrier family 8 (sodium/calcium exchanger)
MEHIKVSATMAICIIAIPKNEIRKIDLIPVYVVTTVFNLFSYVWLVIVLMVITPDVVTLWEAIITFMFFPALILVSYAVDCIYFVLYY